jgi:hypothetical protein
MTEAVRDSHYGAKLVPGCKIDSLSSGTAHHLARKGKLPHTKEQDVLFPLEEIIRKHLPRWRRPIPSRAG